MDFPFQEKIETMDRLAISKSKNSLKQRLDFSVEEKIETMDRLAIIEQEKIVQPMVRISVSRKHSKLWIDWL